MKKNNYPSFSAIIKKHDDSNVYDVCLSIVNVEEIYSDDNIYEITNFNFSDSVLVAQFMLNKDNQFNIVDSSLSINYDKLLEKEFKGTDCYLFLEDDIRKIRTALKYIKRIIIDYISYNITNDDKTIVYSEGYIKDEFLSFIKDEKLFISLDDACVIPSINYLKELISKVVLKEKEKIPVYTI